MAPEVQATGEHAADRVSCSSKPKPDRIPARARFDHPETSSLSTKQSG
jgi:hypothetical protein